MDVSEAASTASICRFGNGSFGDGHFGNWMIFSVGESLADDSYSDGSTHFLNESPTAAVPLQ